jgi:hypothetical protein
VQPHEAYALRLEISKARSRLGWAPQLRIDTTLNWVATWYKRQLAGEAAEQLCREQIEQYCEMGAQELSEVDMNRDVVALPIASNGFGNRGPRSSAVRATSSIVPIQRAG